MALVLRDRVKETTTTTGTATYTLAGAITGFESFGSVGDSNTTYYGCSDGTDFEVGIGTYTASGTTLARTVILQSSNSDNAVNWGAGTKTIFCTLPAEKMSFLDASGNLVAANASALTALNASNLASGTVDNARLDQQLQDVAGLAVTDGNFIVGDGANFVAESGATARTSLGLGTAATSDSTDFVAVTGDAMTGDLTFGDNDKAIFGAGSDLQIFHDGSNSYVQENGTGNLRIRANNLALEKASGGEYYLLGTADGSLRLYYDAAQKLITASTGVDVTGTVTADGLTVDGSGVVRLNPSSGDDFLTIQQGGTQAVITADSTAGAGNLLFRTTSAGSDTDTMLLAANGDISFYDSTGVTQGLYWDASTQRLGLGTTSPVATLDVTGTVAATAVTGDGSGLTNLPAATAGFAVAMAIAL